MAAGIGVPGQGTNPPLVAGVKVKGEFRVSGALNVERDEPVLAHLHRLVFAFNRRDHGRLRELIDYLNDLAAKG